MRINHKYQPKGRDIDKPTDEFRRRLNILIAGGNGMSNICFNFSQQSRFTFDERDLFRRCYQEWDRVKKA